MRLAAWCRSRTGLRMLRGYKLPHGVRDGYRIPAVAGDHPSCGGHGDDVPWAEHEAAEIGCRIHRAAHAP